MNELISVVIPIYNRESTLQKCVDSVLAQTYKNIEVILVNDGSTDRSGDICRRYEQIDPRVKVISKENGGLSSARNAGIDKSCGEYIFFIDSDDWIDSDTLKVLRTPPCKRARMSQAAACILTSRTVLKAAELPMKSIFRTHGRS